MTDEHVHDAFRASIPSEQSMLGVALLWPDLVADVFTMLAPDDFAVPAHQTVWDTLQRMHAAGDEIDTTTVADVIERSTGERLTQLLLECQNSNASISASRRYAATIAEHAVARRVQRVCAEAAQLARQPTTDPTLLAQETIVQLQRSHGPTGHPSDDLLQIDAWIEFAKTKLAERHSRWLIPGMMGPGERCILVGGEGVGKMVLLRQIAQLAAAGLHPTFEGYRIPPIRTMLVDAENPLQALLQTLGPTQAALRKQRIVSGEFHVVARPGGFDLRSAVDRAQLEADVRAVRPDVLVIGPLYKLFRRERHETDEEAATSCQNVLDDLRTRYDFGLFIEHHAPKGSSQIAREMIPFGSSAWMRWPEYGIAMIRRNEPGQHREVEIGRWRDDRIPAYWPDHMTPSTSGGTAASYMWHCTWPIDAYAQGLAPWET